MFKSFNEGIDNSTIVCVCTFLFSSSVTKGRGGYGAARAMCAYRIIDVVTSFLIIVLDVCASFDIVWKERALGVRCKWTLEPQLVLGVYVYTRGKKALLMIKLLFHHEEDGPSVIRWGPITQCALDGLDLFLASRDTLPPIPIASQVS